YQTRTPANAAGIEVATRCRKGEQSDRSAPTASDIDSNAAREKRGADQWQDRRLGHQRNHRQSEARRRFTRCDQLLRSVCGQEGGGEQIDREIATDRSAVTRRNRDGEQTGQGA